MTFPRKLSRNVIEPAFQEDLFGGVEFLPYPIRKGRRVEFPNAVAGLVVCSNSTS